MKKLMVATAAVLLAACSRDIQTSDAVRAGVMDYLQARKAETGLDMTTMQIDVASVSFQQDEAHATVLFRAKTAPGAGGMQMNYTLDRKGGKWVVRGKGEASGSPHGGEGVAGGADGGTTPQLPPNHPSVGTTGGGATSQLPPNHPSVGTSDPGGHQLPQGHPPVGSKQ